VGSTKQIRVADFAFVAAGRFVGGRLLTLTFSRLYRQTSAILEVLRKNC
jgi:hypothetical protein